MSATIDIRNDHCPMTFVKVKLQLAKIKPGEVLKVFLKGDEPLQNIPKAAIEQGHKIIETRQLQDYYQILIEKGI